MEQHCGGEQVIGIAFDHQDVPALAGERTWNWLAGSPFCRDTKMLLHSSPRHFGANVLQHGAPLIGTDRKKVAEAGVVQPVEPGRRVAEVPAEQEHRGGDSDGICSAPYPVLSSKPFGPRSMAPPRTAAAICVPL